MNQDLQNALITGTERLAAWTDLLDLINVFPVADGDTGRNMLTSLSPLKQTESGGKETTRKLLFSARGNSGNIATRFIAGLLVADSIDFLPSAMKSGRDMAWQAIHSPVHGTMLDVLDALVEIVHENDMQNILSNAPGIIDRLEIVVKSTRERLPKLKAAGVVDAGALGIFIFLEGFLLGLANRTEALQPVTLRFNGFLEVSSSFIEPLDEKYCVDMVVRFDQGPGEQVNRLSDHGDSIVVIPHDDFHKVHLHTGNTESVRKEIEKFCTIIHWEEDSIDEQIEAFSHVQSERSLHIMTDAAGSIAREEAQNLGITLLDSYITAGDKTLPETLFSPEELYKTMRNGVKVSSSQASIFERDQYYQSVLDRYKKVLYICVGSVYTGNYLAAIKWKKENDPDDRFTVIDSGAASGRLGTIVMATNRFAVSTDNPDEVIEYAKNASETCEEYVFLDKLQYLAAGGRLSKPSAFFGDLLHMKPVICPVATGAEKAAVLRNLKEQRRFAMKKLANLFNRESKPLIMLQYTDNKEMVENLIKNEIEELYPFAQILLHPLSLTSGVHMGPGTWSLAFIQDPIGSD